MSMLRSTPGARSSGPIWSKKMNGPTMRRFANGSTRPTSMPPPRLRRRCSITSIMTSACGTWYWRVEQLLFPQVGDAAGQDSWHAEGFGGLGQGGRIVDDCLRIVAVQVRELVWLVVN